MQAAAPGLGQPEGRGGVIESHVGKVVLLDEKPLLLGQSLHNSSDSFEDLGVTDNLLGRWSALIGVGFVRAVGSHQPQRHGRGHSGEKLRESHVRSFGARDRAVRVFFIELLENPIRALHGSQLAVDASRQMAPLANPVNHRSSHAQVGPATKRNSSGLVEGLRRAKEPLSAERTEVVERHGKGDRSPHLASQEVDQIELGLEAGENLRRVRAGDGRHGFARATISARRPAVKSVSKGGRTFCVSQRLLLSNVSMSEDPAANDPNLAERGSAAPARGGEGEGAIAADPRIAGAWKTWLVALATDAEAALGAALAYDSLPAHARSAWLDALEADARDLGIPAVALYAPLLSVEADNGRRARMESALASAPIAVPIDPVHPHAFRGVAADGTHACIVTSPLYLDFVQVCGVDTALEWGCCLCATTPFDT